MLRIANLHLASGSLHSIILHPAQHTFLHFLVLSARFTKKKVYKRKALQQGASVMHHHYKKPDVCLPFKTTRDCDRRCLSSVCSCVGRALNWINGASGGIATGGWALHLQECPHAVIRHTHMHEHMYIKGGPATTASQEEKKKTQTQWRCLRTTMSILLFDSVKAQRCTYGAPLRGHAHTI